MLSKTLRVVLFSSLLTSTFAAPIHRWKREVPQEHSHEATIRAVRDVLNLNNPDGIVDVVFGLLGNAAASQGLGKLTDPDCLQTATADQAFSNAKAAGDVEGMTQSLIYRALERNTGKVGLASVACTSFIPVNPEVAALSQHQDPASTDAAAINKAIVLELAKQINSIGGNPLDALKSGTFAPGDVNDATAKGNTCDDENDAAGCIFTLNLIVFDATEEEILAAVGGADGGAAESSGAEETATETASDASETATETSAEETATATETASDASETATATETATDVTDTATATATATEETATATETASAGNGGGKGHGGKGRGGRGGNRGNGRGGRKGTGRGGRGRGRNGGNGNNNGGDNTATETATATDVEETATATATDSVATETPTATDESAAPEASQTTAATQNLQTFTGALGGILPPPVTEGGRNFETNGADFLNLGAALGRSCDVQHNKCANAANSGADFTVGDCDQQNNDCRALINA